MGFQACVPEEGPGLRSPWWGGGGPLWFPHVFGGEEGPVSCSLPQAREGGLGQTEYQYQGLAENYSTHLPMVPGGKSFLCGEDTAQGLRTKEQREQTSKYS